MPTPVYLVVGPPAVGKSTTARALAASFPRAIRVGVDELRDQVVSGRVLPGPDWSDDLVQQLRAARATAVFIARTYRDLGFAVVIDDFWDPHSRLVEYAELAAEPDVHRIALLPPVSAAHARNLHRSGGTTPDPYIGAAIDATHDATIAAAGDLARSGWTVIDNADLSVKATVAAIMTSA